MTKMLMMTRSALPQQSAHEAMISGRITLYVQSANSTTNIHVTFIRTATTT